MQRLFSYLFPSSSSSSSSTTTTITTEALDDSSLAQQKQERESVDEPLHVLSSSSSSSSLGKDKEVEEPVVVEYDDIDLDTIIKRITREEVQGVPDCYMLHNVLSQRECDQFLNIITQIGVPKEGVISECKFWRAPSSVMYPVWRRVSSHFPKTVNDEGYDWSLVENNPMNDKFRYYTYDSGYVREKHFDGCFLRNNPGISRRDQSHFTFLIYLNEGFDGGETTFYPGGVNSLSSPEITHKEVRVNPRMGSALVFRQTGPSRPLHEGSVHRSEGMKKCLVRSDIMYTKIEA
eukprot:TRINITY_DN5310_c0_g1_i2.p1 TRINITY_DN5310_c0_g1~~TRINITY_DN5310_c0_g1_i2.p1  ORF type:complete len:291 (+),score=67.72 TRINITY_DN5310_c0_g1_i2:63-935(+)